MKPILLSVLFLAAACSAQSYQPAPILNPRGTTLSARFNPPPGYTRIEAARGSYAEFLRTLPLKPDGSPALYFDGREKPNPRIYAAVLRMDVGTGDLQQCADAVMRMRAEYLYANGLRTAIAFQLTNGFRADYAHWSKGYRIAITGNKTRWVKNAAAADDYATFRKYLNVVFSYAGSRSLASELKTVAVRDMAIGDVLIVGGSPGHAVTVMDMSQGAGGRKVYLLSQSYMPAQDIQILCNPDNPAISPWYELPAGPGAIRTPQRDFTTTDLKRFR